jgi:hypothetical protein
MTMWRCCAPRTKTPERLNWSRSIAPSKDSNRVCQIFKKIFFRHKSHNKIQQMATAPSE